MMFQHSLLLTDAAPLVSWSKAIFKIISYLAHFAIFGALGFRFLVLRSRGAQHADSGADSAALASVHEVAERHAARIGLVGALLVVLDFVVNIMSQASAKGISVVDAARRGDPEDIAEIVLAPLLIIAFALALRRARGAWVLAGLAGIALALRHVVTGRWVALINPLHEFAGALWLGTLFMIVIAGLPAILRSAASGERRGRLVAELLARFSPLALAAAAVLGVTGVVTAWRHLKYVAALWTTPYGYALDAKLFVVCIVVALGAWNWRRVLPRLGEEDAAHALRRSSTTELLFAGVVLLITAVLVSLPGPKLPTP
jgi:copper transport protein